MAEGEFCTLNGIVDEHGFYKSYTGFVTLSPFSLRTAPTGVWIDEAKAFAPGEAVAVNSAGLHGFYAGPNAVLIDRLALTDPLLARLPMMAGPWRIGHFKRELPDGYLEARSKGSDASGMDKDLAEYDTKLTLVTGGPLFSAQRLKTIVGFQLNKYDGLKNSYIARHCDEFYSGCASPSP